LDCLEVLEALDYFTKSRLQPAHISHSTSGVSVSLTGRLWRSAPPQEARSDGICRRIQRKTSTFSRVSEIYRQTSRARTDRTSHC